MENIISLILNFIVAGGITVFLFYRSRRRREEASASAAEIENKESEFGIYKEQIRFLNESLQQAYSEVDKMQDIINGKRCDIIELMRRAGQLEVDLCSERKARQMVESMVCNDMECVLRKKYRMYSK